MSWGKYLHNNKASKTTSLSTEGKFTVQTHAKPQRHTYLMPDNTEKKKRIKRLRNVSMSNTPNKSS